MSDSVDVDPRKKPQITVSIDRTPEIDSLHQELAEKKVQLEQIAKAEFEKQCADYGLDPETTSPDVLQATKALKEYNKAIGHAPAPRGGDTAQLNASQREGRTIEDLRIEKERDQLPLDMLEFENLQDMVDYVSKVANDGRDERNKQARRVMGKLIHNFTDKSQTYEFQGGIRDILNAKKDPSKKLLFDKVEDEGEK